MTYFPTLAGNLGAYESKIRLSLFYWGFWKIFLQVWLNGCLASYIYNSSQTLPPPPPPGPQKKKKKKKKKNWIDLIWILVLVQVCKHTLRSMFYKGISIQCITWALQRKLNLCNNSFLIIITFHAFRAGDKRSNKWSRFSANEQFCFIGFCFVYYVVFFFFLFLYFKISQNYIFCEILCISIFFPNFMNFSVFCIDHRNWGL